MRRVLLHEVGPRDGLQVEKTVVPSDRKTKWIEASAAAGMDFVQVGSFVHPEKVPQMADTDELFRSLTKSSCPTCEHEHADSSTPRKALLSGLVLNEKGLERALACGVELLSMGASASETHSRKNTGMGTEEATRRILGMARAAREAGKPVQLSVQSAFGCGFEGPVPEERVVSIARSYVEEGFLKISLADTAGHGHPEQVQRLFEKVQALAPGIELASHFHDTYGLGMANVFAALRAGVTTIESSFAGLGGCPFTKVAAGNVPTEDVVHSLQRMGIRRDVDLAKLITVARDVAAFFGREMPGRVYRAGPIPSVAQAQEVTA